MKGDNVNNFNLRKLFLPLVALLLLLSSCNLSDEKDPSIIGTWTNSYGDISITNEVYDAGFSGGDIISFSDKEAVSGHFVIVFTKSWGDAANGKYGVVRWRNLTEDSVEYLEGYNNGIYFDSADEAVAGMDDSFFPVGLYTPLERK